MKKCKQCQNKFEPKFSSVEMFCSRLCSIKYSNKKKSEKAKKGQIPKRPAARSKKRAKEERSYSVDRKEFLSRPENKFCPITGKRTSEIHHQKGRIGSFLNDKKWWIALSCEGHKKVEENPIWARRNAFSYSRLEKEFWISVYGYEGFYECSSFGRFRSLDRNSKTKSGVLKTTKGTILKQTIKKEGYLSVMLSINGQKRRFNSHRLILQSFTESNGVGMDVHHKNGKRSQNHYLNLEWLKTAEHKKINSPRLKKGEQKHNSKLTSEKVLAIRRLFRINPNFNRKKLSEKLNVEDTTIIKVIKNQRWKHL